MNRRSYSLNLGFLRKNKPTEYFYIQDYENTNERFCKKVDKNNDMIYARNISLYTRTKKFLEKNNAIFKMEGPPDPPRVPSNYELFIIHKNRNSHTNNKIQTMAILYLLHHEYKLVIDPAIDFIPKVLNRENKLFEPYMAISLASSVNKNFIKEIAKYYEMGGERIESPELLSIEEKINHYNKNGVIEYLDVATNGTSSSGTTVKVANPSNEIIANNSSVAASAPPPIVENKQDVIESVPISPTAHESSYPLLSEIPSLVSNPPPYGTENTAPDNRKGINIFINK